MKPLEQDIPTLLAIRDFTFDLDEPGFLDFFIQRTGIQLTKVEAGMCSVRLWIQNPPDISWQITRAKLQNCWEAYQQNAPVLQFSQIPSDQCFAKAPQLEKSIAQLSLF